MISVATKRTLTSHGFYLHFFFKHVFHFMIKTFLFLVCNFPQLFQLFIFNHILWIIAVPFFLVYQTPSIVSFESNSFKLFQLFSVFDRLPPTHGLHLSEILKLGHCLTLQWSLWQEVFGRSLVGGSWQPRDHLQTSFTCLLFVFKHVFH